MFGTLNLTQSTAPPWEYSTNCWFTEKIRSQTRSSLNQEVACLFLEQLIHIINLQYLLNLKQLVVDNQGEVDRLSDDRRTEDEDMSRMATCLPDSITDKTGPRPVVPENTRTWTVRREYKTPLNEN